MRKYEESAREHMKVTYYYNACVGIETPDVSVLCDPWFTEGVYDGSWYHFPAFPNALETIPKYDYVYISHIHPDHYDPTFLKAYLKKYPNTKVISADFGENILDAEMTKDGISHTVVEEMRVGETSLKIFPNDISSDDVDSALVVKWGAFSIVNMNDNLYNEKQLSRITDYCPSPSVALLGYIGAGPYPQTYFDDPKVLAAKAAAKREQMFERYRTLRDALRPKISVPFAGQYILGGGLWGLNKYRGVADATEVLAFDPTAIVLETGGSLDVETLKTNDARTEPYGGLEAYAESLKDRPMDYEKRIPKDSDFKFEQLLPKAYACARAHSYCETDYYFCIKLEERWFYMNARKGKDECGFADSIEHLTPRSEMTVPPPYLYGLVTSIYHWSNAQIGSQYRVRRVPDVFNRSAEAFLNFFHA